MANHPDSKVTPLHRAVPPRDYPERAQVVDFDEVERRLRGPAQHRRIRSPLLDDLRDLFAEIRASWASHLLVGLFGFALGSFGIVGLAWLTVQVVS